MIRARLLGGQTCSSAPDVGPGAELALSMGEGASGEAVVTAVTCSEWADQDLLMR